MTHHQVSYVIVLTISVVQERLLLRSKIDFKEQKQEGSYHLLAAIFILKSKNEDSLIRSQIYFKDQKQKRSFIRSKIYFKKQKQED